MTKDSIGKYAAAIHRNAQSIMGSKLDGIDINNGQYDFFYFISRHAYLLKGIDGNYSIIDCGMPASAKKVLKAMSDLRINKANLKLIIITHGHADHMGACSALRKATGAKTIIHKMDADVIRNGEAPQLKPTNTTGKLFSHIFGTKVKGFIPYEPEIIINGEFLLYDFGIPGKIIETSGHTYGSISVLLDDGNLFVGDLIMGGMMGKGKPKIPMFADNLDCVRENIKRVINISPKMVYTGHGGPFSINEIRNDIYE